MYDWGGMLMQLILTGRALLSHGNDNWPLVSSQVRVFFCHADSWSFHNAAISSPAVLTIFIHIRPSDFPPASSPSRYLFQLLSHRIPRPHPRHSFHPSPPSLSSLQKPNDIVNWIRKHYPAEWDGDEGRCSAHRVRTYLARKGADMYYEKLNQGSITGWRIRQNHLWRFENGGFMGRGMKQEEAIAAAHKENEAIATAAHKAAAAEALAAGHPGVKVSMSAPGVHDGAPPNKRARKSAGQARRKNAPRPRGELLPGGTSISSDIGNDSSSAFPTSTPDHYQPTYVDASSSGQNAMNEHSTAHQPSNEYNIDPTLMSAAQHGDSEVDMDMVQQAMQAAAAANAGQMDELDMQLPIEMRMHAGDEGDGSGDGGYQGFQGVHHPYTPHGQDQWAQSQVYGSTGYNAGQ